MCKREPPQNNHPKSTIKLKAKFEAIYILKKRLVRGETYHKEFVIPAWIPTTCSLKSSSHELGMLDHNL
jgi:hypothetical protein